MSHRRLPNARGTVIACDGEGCGVVSQTGQVYIALHWMWLRVHAGWGRGSLRPTKHGSGTTGLRLCSSCLAVDQAAAERRRRPKFRAIRRQRAAAGAAP